MNEVLAALREGWNSGSGAEFAAVFADDAHFVTVRGDRLHGRAEVADRHQSLFDTVFAGTTLATRLRAQRDLADGIVVLDVDFLVTPRQGETVLTTAFAVVQQGNSGWRITAFHNMIPVR